MMRRMRISEALSVFAAVAIATSAYAAGTEQYKFVNKTNRTATDLHIEFNGTVTWSPPAPTQVPANAFATSNGTGTNTVDLADGFTGTGVPADGDVVLSFNYGGGTPPKVTKAYWTKSNTLTPNEGVDTLRGPNKEHLLHPDKTIKNQFASVAASGNGILVVTLDGTPHQFFQQTGETGTAAAARFATFVENLQFGTVRWVDNNSVYITSDIMDGNQPLAVQVVQPDNAQSVTVSEIAFPGVSPVSIGVLIGLLAIAGALVVARRRGTLSA